MEYILDIPGIMMNKWRHVHLMETTTNPIEICMKDLQEARYGLGSCRDASLFNKYRYLIKWIFERMESRYRSLCFENRQSYKTNFQIPCHWAEIFIKKLGHYYECYKSQFKVLAASGDAENINRRINEFIVRDIGLHTSYTVNIRNHTCTCHEMYWRKLPCLHYMAVLHRRGEFSSVWDAVGGEYTQSSVMNTCHSVTEDEKTVLNEIINTLQPHVIHIGSDSHEFLNKRGRVTHNSRRVPSRGEYTE